MSYRLLLYEPDKTVANLLSYRFRQTGYQISTVSTEAMLFQIHQHQSFDMIILDVHDNPDFTPLIPMRSTDATTPIIILTAMIRDQDIAEAFYKGADDVVRKPFGYGELLSRIDAILRRTLAYQLRPMTVEPEEAAYQFSFLTLYPQRLELVIHENSISLSALECQLLLLFLQHPGVPLTRMQLRQELFGDTVDTVKIERIIAGLRKKIKLAKPFIQIDTLPRVGYKLTIQNL
ncbi:response regulator transcription factor [Paenibacillus sp. 1P07SE]|uniref:response regulator transcription factor n=1 Tax=Paenibacillus sp. 1P07SE TaxID=3132209 RepID=UPI0039A50965